MCSDRYVLTMPTCVVISPLRGGNGRTTIENLEFLRTIMRKLYLAGFAPYAPHAEIPLGTLSDAVPEERKMAIRAGIRIGMCMDCAIVVEDFGISEGMKQEIRSYALMKPYVFYIRMDDTNIDDRLKAIAKALCG